MRDGIVKGLHFSESEKAKALENIHICSNCDHSGPEFFEKIVAPAIETCMPDLLVIDPALAYLGARATTKRMWVYFFGTSSTANQAAQHRSHNRASHQQASERKGESGLVE